MGLSRTPLGTLWGGIVGPVGHFVVSLERPRALWSGLAALLGRTWDALGAINGATGDACAILDRPKGATETPTGLQGPPKGYSERAKGLPRALQRLQEA